MDQDRNALRRQARKLTGCLALVLVALAPPAHSVALTNVFSTGLAADGTSLVPGGIDAHWDVTLDPVAGTTEPRDARASTPAGAQVSNVGNGPSRWISAHTSGASFSGGNADGTDRHIAEGAPYDHIFAQKFDLTGFNPSTTVITGRWAVDNEGEIFLNGVSTGFGLFQDGPPLTDADPFIKFYSFTISSGFVGGENLLEVRVNNTGSVVALRVEISSATADEAVAGVPEPSAAALLCIALGCMALVRRGTRRTAPA